MSEHKFRNFLMKQRYMNNTSEMDKDNNPGLPQIRKNSLAMYGDVSKKYTLKNHKTNKTPLKLQHVREERINRFAASKQVKSQRPSPDRDAEALLDKMLS